MTPSGPGYYLATMSDNSKEGAITATSGNCHTLQVLQYTSKGKLYSGRQAGGSRHGE